MSESENQLRRMVSRFGDGRENDNSAPVLSTLLHNFYESKVVCPNDEEECFSPVSLSPYDDIACHERYPIDLWLAGLVNRPSVDQRRVNRSVVQKLHAQFNI